MKKNKNRQMIKILKEICSENGICYHSFSSDWIVELSQYSKVMHIYGYKFPQNNAVAACICDDKAAVSDILISHGIPCVEHSFFMSPKNMQYIGD